MDSTQRAEAKALQAEITAQQRLLDGLDDAINTLSVSRKHGVARLFDLQSQLASIAAPHYEAMALEAMAMAKDQAQGRAEDFRMGGAA